MSKQRERTRGRWGALVTVVVMVALLGFGGSAATAGAGPTAPAQAPPGWCQWIPPEWRQHIPECQGNGEVEPGSEVEEQFSAAGPSQVTTSQASDGSGAYTLFYPTNLANDGFDNPILAYGNGTGASCAQGDRHRHMASWGFAVVCPNTENSGWGTEIWAGVQFMIAQDGNPASPFYQELDTTKVGAYGHSQGATGAANATVLSDGVITSTIGIALVDPLWHGDPAQLPSLDEIDTPVLLISGTSDFLTSQTQQQAYFNQVAGPAAKAAVVGATHDASLDRGLGYPTAWFKYTLQGDQFARSAFVGTDGNPPEVSTNSAWTNWAAKNLP